MSKLSLEQREQALEMYKSGATLAEVAKKFGVVYSTLNYHRLRAGIPKNDYRGEKSKLYKHISAPKDIK